MRVKSYISLLFLPFLFINQFLAAQSPEAGFLVKFKDEVTPHKITGAFILPGEEIKIETLFEDKDYDYDLFSEHGEITTNGKNSWKWRAPENTGNYPVIIKKINSLDSMILNCIVMVPLSEIKNGEVNGFKTGDYPKSTNPLYQLPKGLIEVTKENENTKVSPHYKLKDFLCKQAGGYPKYVVLRERGILKLELVQSHLISQGIKFERFSFISGYRTPYYNKSIGNVKFSRHVFGDAYDVYIDANKDAQMDDLNKDGAINKKDAAYLFSLINKIYSEPWYKPFIGGMGLYGPNSRHTSFIHLDARGNRARWGQ